MNIQKTLSLVFALTLSITSINVFAHAGCCGCNSTKKATTTKKIETVTAVIATAVIAPALTEEEKAAEQAKVEAQKIAAAKKPTHVHGTSCSH